MSDYSDAIGYLREAASVTFVVHGVGEHRRTGSGILRRAELALGPLLNSSSNPKRVTLNQVPRPPAYTPDLDLSSPTPGPDPEIACLPADDGYHVILPVVWSGVRPRLTDPARYAAAGGMSLTRLINAAMPVMLESFRDAVGCIPKAKAGAMRVRGTLFVIGYLLTSIGLYLGIVSAISCLVFSWKTFSHKEWLARLLFVLVLLVFRTSICALLKYLDFVGDVLSYIGHPGRREAIEETMWGMIERTAALAPRAELIIIGHSLGSVLATHCLLRRPASDSIGKRVIVMTLGSPLRNLSRYFPGIISAPEEIVRSFQETGIVAGWVNLWRDADVIGRQLKPDPVVPLFAETSLGDGPHSDYWGDRRLWEQLALVIQWATTKGPQQPLAAAIGVGHGLTEDDDRQLAVSRLVDTFAAVTHTSFGGVLLWITASRAGASGHWLVKPSWAVFAAATVTVAACSVRVGYARGDHSNRLAVERLWKPWRVFLARVWVMSALTLMLTVWWNVCSNLFSSLTQ